MANGMTKRTTVGLDTCQAILERVAVMLKTYNEVVKDEELPIPAVSITALALAYHGIDKVRGYSTIADKVAS